MYFGNNFTKFLNVLFTLQNLIETSSIIDVWIFKNYLEDYRDTR